MKKFLIMSLFATFASTTTFAMLPPKQVPCTNGRTPLMLAILNSQSITEPLIQDHINSLNQQDVSGRTALHYAALSNNKITIALLIKYGANRSLKDCDEKTAENLASEQQKIIAQSESHFYEHHEYQEPTPSYEDSSSKTTVTLHRPGSVINLRNHEEQNKTDAAPASEQQRIGFYASLL